MSIWLLEREQHLAQLGFELLSNRTPVCQPPCSGQNSSSTKLSMGGAPSTGNGPRANTEGGGVLFMAAKAQKKAAQGERLKVGPEVGTSELQSHLGDGEP